MRRILLPIVLFVAVSIAFCLGWMRIAGGYGRLLAEPLAQVLLRVSPDVIYVDHDQAGQPDIVLENSSRRPMERIVRNVTGYTFPVFASLIVCALVTPLRSRLTGRAGALRIGAGLIVMALWNASLTIVVGSYAVAAANRGTVPGVLRLAGTFGDVAQVFVPFVLFAVLFMGGSLPASAGAFVTGDETGNATHPGIAPSRRQGRRGDRSMKLEDPDSP